MKLNNLLVLFLLTVGGFSYADSDGYGCYGKGVIAFDEALKDRTGLYLILWGSDSGISEKYRVELPRKHGSYSQGISCKNNKVSIILREKVEAPRNESRYVMHITEISVATPPSIISDTKNHYQVWKNYTQKILEPINDSTPIESLPEANLRLGGYNNECTNRKVLLESEGSKHRYHLVFDSGESESTVTSGNGIIYHRCTTKVVMTTLTGEFVKEVLVAETEKQETIH